MSEETFFLEIINFYVKFWFLSLVLRWFLSFLPWKLFEIVRSLGAVVRYPVKKFFYWLYGVKTEKIDITEGIFETEEVSDFDCRVTSNVVGPLIILTYIGSFFLYWANYFYTGDLKWLGGLFFVFAFSILLMSAPDLKEAEELVHVSVRSIFKWMAKVFVVATPGYLLLHYLVGIEPFAQAAFILGLMIPFYFHKSRKKIENPLKIKTTKLVEADPFGE